MRAPVHQSHQILLSMNSVDDLFVDQLREIFQVFDTLRDGLNVSQTCSYILYGILNIPDIRHRSVRFPAETDVFT